MAYYLFNLTNANYDVNSSTFFLNGTTQSVNNSNPDFSVWFEDHISVQQNFNTLDCLTTMRLTNVSSGGPFDIYTNDTSAVQSLQVSIEFNSSGLNQSLNTMMTYNLGSSIQWGLFAGVLTVTVVTLVLVCLGSIQADLSLDYFSRVGQSAYSMLLLSIVYFQYFGLYVMLLMMIQNSYFIFYVVACVALVIMISASFKTAFLIHLEQNQPGANIAQGGIRTARGRFICLAVTLMVANYLVAVIAIRFTSYAFYLSIISSFPLIAIVENSFRGLKRCFSKYSLMT